MTTSASRLPALPGFKRIVELLARQAAAECIRAGTAWAVSTSSAIAAQFPAPLIITCGTDGGYR